MVMVDDFDEDDWRAQRDVEILADAEKIKSDPARLAKAQDKAREQMQAASRVAGASPEEVDTLRRGFTKV